MPVIYKITRTDGLQYIGIAKNFKSRLGAHRRSKRFEIGISDAVILFEGEWDKCNELEAAYIQKYDTFTQGLNLTPQGKGRNESSKFNTFGYRFSEASRKKMSDAKKGKIPSCVGWNKGIPMTDVVKAKVRRNGEQNSGAKLTEIQVKSILKIFDQKLPLDNVGKIQPNGRIMSYIQAFSLQQAEIYGISYATIKHIVTGKSWKHVSKQ